MQKDIHQFENQLFLACKDFFHYKGSLYTKSWSNSSDLSILIREIWHFGFERFSTL